VRDLSAVLRVLAVPTLFTLIAIQVVVAVL